MSQTFSPGTPATSSAAISSIIRDNFTSLANNHSGVTVPAYAVEGMQWYDENVQRHKRITPRGSKAFGGYNLGATIRLAITLPTEGQDGSLLNADVRVQDGTLLAPNYDWSLVGSALKVYFKSTTTPAYFASKHWNDAVIDEPILWTADGILTGKTWESIVLPAHENVYTAVSSPLSNVAPFASSTLRGMEVEYDGKEIRQQIVLASAVDHTTFPLTIEWWENNFSLVQFFEDGVEQDPLSYKFRAFRWGGQTLGILYRIDPLTETLVNFSTISRKVLVLRKAS